MVHSFVGARFDFPVVDRWCYIEVKWRSVWYTTMRCDLNEQKVEELETLRHWVVGRRLMVLQTVLSVLHRGVNSRLTSSSLISSFPSLVPHRRGVWVARKNTASPPRPTWLLRNSDCQQVLMQGCEDIHRILHNSWESAWLTRRMGATHFGAEKTVTNVRSL